MSKEIAKVFVFRSDSNPNVTYETLQYSDGETSCNCKGWTFKRRNTPDGERSCKHTRMVDMNMAESACVRHVDYMPVAPVARVRSPQMRQQHLSPKRNRVLYLDQV